MFPLICLQISIFENYFFHLDFHSILKGSAFLSGKEFTDTEM